MPFYKNKCPDKEYLDSIKKHTDRETNKVNLALVANDLSYVSGKSFYKKYTKLKKAHNLTKDHIYGNEKCLRPAKGTAEITKSVLDIMNEHIKASAEQCDALLKGKSSERDSNNEASPAEFS
ncbi:hypothetical protein Pdw03_8405 [Penicillium digitatum]|uniref:Uncharacterized protein n=1 Tax=Penicillium digitatum TaxID=36651 RepID=A0A7T6XNL5_PENDI|nr:hypothetical protein Pdw03_8405 [Penicillium digitatum]